MDAPVCRLVFTTYGRISIITRRSFTSCSQKTRDFSSSRRTGLWTCPAFVVSLSFARRYRRGCLLLYLSSFARLFTTSLRLDSPVFFTSTADVSRFPEACERWKLQESPFEQDPFDFHWKHSPVLRLVKEFCPFPLVTAARSVISLWILKFYFFDLVQCAISQTHSWSVIISFSSTSQNFWITKCKNCLSIEDLATWKRTDPLKLCPVEDHLLKTMLAPNVNQNPECRRSPI